MAKNILIVDDSATMLRVIKTTLETNGFSVETAGDGVQAIAKLSGGYKPDLIITDINMPNMIGLDMIRNIRLMPNFRFTPIITLTAESHAAMRDEAKKLGATGWLMKPISGPDLVKVIKQILPGA